MSKYTSIQSTIFSVFATAEWIAEDINVVPENYQGKSTYTEYIRVNIIYPSGDSIYRNNNFVYGILSIDIFTPTGEGPKRANEIADRLDYYFSAKTISPVQFLSSSLVPFGRDKDNASLYRTIYTINYKYFGDN